MIPTILAGAARRFRTSPAPAVVGLTATLLLVFVGIHNAWDTVTFIALTRGVQERPHERAREAAEPTSTVTSPAAETST